MDTLSQFKNELEAEYHTTRKFLKLIRKERTSMRPMRKV